jgi:hypothetical protein
MTRIRNRKLDRWLLAAGAAALLVLTVPVPAAEAADSDEIPIQLREELEAVVGARAGEIYAEKDASGRRFQRANFSKKFHKVDDDTYRVTFTKDIVTDNRLKTERYLLTLRKSGSKWVAGDEELQSSYVRMLREVPGDEKFYVFDSFSFDREGMKITAGKGSAVVDFLDDEPDQVIFTGSGLRYDYAPPIELSFHHNQRYQLLKKQHPEDFTFDAEGVLFNCDAVTCQEFLDSAFTDLKEATHADLDPELQKFFDKALKEQNEQRKSNVFSGFRLPLEPDRRLYDLQIKRRGRDQWISLYYDNKGPWEVYFSASDYGPLWGYPSETTLAAGVEPYEVELRDDFNALLYDLKGLKGEVDVAIHDPELLRADITYKLELKRDLHEIPFSLYNIGRSPSPKAVERKGAITIDAVQDADGEDLTWVRRGGTGGWVVFPELVPAGTEIELRIAYQTTGSIKKIGPSYSYVDRGGWLPFVRLTDRIEEFELTVNAPSRYKTMSVGTKMGEKTAGGITTTHWKAFNDVGFPTIIFGVYEEATPKTKATKMDGTEIPVTIHVDRDAMSQWGIRPKQLLPFAEQAVNALNIFREIYGVDYPYGKLDLVNDPDFWGAQSPASIVYIGSGAFRNEATLQEWTGSRGDWFVEMNDSMVAHEVAHQWWAWVFTHANNRNYWFIESLAEYSSALFLEIVESEGYKKPEKGRQAYLEHVQFWREEILENDLMTSVQDSFMWGGESGFGSYRALVYSKGPYAFHILRSTFGDEKFFDFLRNMGQELAGKRIVTRDIQRVAEQSFGGTMEWFFDQWIRGVGIPEYSFNYSYRQTEDGNYLVQGNVKQRVVAGLKKNELNGVYFRGVVPVTVLGKDKQEYPAKLLVEGAETPFAFKVPVEPLEITLNKYGEILAHPTLENRGW